MLWNTFDRDRAALDGQYKTGKLRFGLDAAALEAGAKALRDRLEAENTPRGVIRAELLAYVLRNAPVSVEPKEWFADRSAHGGIYQKMINKYIAEGTAKLPEIRGEAAKAWSCGAWRGDYDFGHTCPDWNDIFKLGITGLVARVRAVGAEKPDNGFYTACITALSGLSDYALRLADCAADEAEENPSDAERLGLLSDCLASLTKRPPETLYEALELYMLYFYVYEMVGGTRLRSLGGVDRLLYRFYESDISSVRYTEAQAKELLRYFLNKLSAMDVPFNLPFCVGGMAVDGSCVVTRLSYLILEAYDENKIYSPKIHVRVTDDTPDDFLRLACRCIRGGNSSILFMYDDTVIDSLARVGMDPVEARDYVPIGCYEPAVMGREVPCTGCGSLNLAKAVEHAVSRGDYADFDSFYAAVKRDIEEMTARALNAVSSIEAYYGEMYSAPLLSATMRECVESGKDAYESGAKYNNSSLNFASAGTAADSLAMVKKYVFDEKRLTFAELKRILAADWEGSELLRREILNDPDKWGNNRELPDRFARELAEVCEAVAVNRPNGRGGVFKAGFYSIDRNVYYGERTGATPDGRKKGEPLAKNLCASVGMDKEGATALVASAAKLDHAAFANGTVLDIVLHPTTVSGAEGLEVMIAIVKAYFAGKGMAVHFNVFDAELLREAQKHPELYQSLQVRVCGWNVRFVNLSRVEQDAFIIQAEHAV